MEKVVIPFPEKPYHRKLIFIIEDPITGEEHPVYGDDYAFTAIEAILEILSIDYDTSIFDLQ